METTLFIYQSNITGSEPERLFNQWSEIVYPWLSHSLRVADFDKNSTTLRKYCFVLKNGNFPIYVSARTYLEARLKFWTAFRQKKKIKFLKFEHDRLLSAVSVFAENDARLIGLSHVSILQQQKEA